MKIGIIGGAGRVGSNLAYALQLAGLGSEIVLVDANPTGARGEALDLLHGCAYCAPQRFGAGSYEDLVGSDAVVITAGLRRKPEESRLDLIHRNVELFLDILAQLSQVSLGGSCHLVVVTNPVDILTQLAVERSGLPPRQVMGLGTVLDTLRFRSLLAESLQLSAPQVQALILGEHGDSMVPIWSTANVEGVPLTSLPNYNPQKVMQVFERTRTSGAEVISLKGGAGYAVGVAILEVLRALLLDSKAILPVSTLQQGAYGIRELCLSLPTQLGRQGVEAIVEMELWPKEVSALGASAQALNATMQQVLCRSKS